MDLYDKLGVDKNATKDEIKKAHRKGVKKHHPDKGGDAEEFTALQVAYETLSDDAKRRRYDETGEYGNAKQDSFEMEFMNFLNQVIIPSIDGRGDLEFDLIGKAINEVKKSKRRTVEELRENKRAKSKLEKASKRIKRKDGGHNLILDLVNGRIQSYSYKIEEMEKALLVYDKIIEEIRLYEWEFDSDKKEMESDWPTRFSEKDIKESMGHEEFEKFFKNMFK